MGITVPDSHPQVVRLISMLLAAPNGDEIAEAILQGLASANDPTDGGR